MSASSDRSVSLPTPHGSVEADASVDVPPQDVDHVGDPTAATTALHQRLISIALEEPSPSMSQIFSN